MKNKILSVFVLLLCLFVVVFGVSCDEKNKEETVHPIDAFNEKMENEENYQILMTMSNVPVLGSISIMMKVDRNIRYMRVQLLGVEQYYEQVGDVEYIYEQNEFGGWTKKVNDSSSDSTVPSDESMEEIFKSENYELVEGTENKYKQKSDVTFEQYEDVVIIIEEYSYTIEMFSTKELYNIKMVISKFGEVDITLPAVQ